MPRIGGRVPAAVWAPLGALVAVVLTGELLLAWFTEGTADVVIFESFADTVGAVGPLRIYGLDSAGLMVYNHPPLTGWWLTITNVVVRESAVPFGFMIRLPSVVAHAATVYLVLDLVRRRRPLRWAVASAVLVACSPVLVILSGFHGNTDTVVAMLTIASASLLVDRRRPVLAGLAFSVAISVKIVPIVALPVLLVAAAHLGRRDLLRFLAGGVPVFLLVWMPVLMSAGRGFATHVLGYAGTGFPRVWGWYGLIEGPGGIDAGGSAVAGFATYVVLVGSALVPAWLMQGDPRRAPGAIGVALSLLLALTPSWAPQYLAWVGAAVFLVEFWSAATFTIVAGCVYAYLYHFWSGHEWELADVEPPTGVRELLLHAVWLTLVASAVVGLRLMARDRYAVTSGRSSSSRESRYVP